MSKVKLMNRVIPKILDEYSSKNKDVRAKIIQYIFCMLSSYPTSTFDKYLQQLTKVISNALADSHPNTRSAARETFVKFQDIFPSQGDQIYYMLPLSTQKYIEEIKQTTHAHCKTPNPSKASESKKIILSGKARAKDDISIKVNPVKPKLALLSPSNLRDAEQPLYSAKIRPVHSKSQKNQTTILEGDLNDLLSDLDSKVWSRRMNSIDGIIENMKSSISVIQPVQLERIIQQIVNHMSDVNPSVAMTSIKSIGVICSLFPKQIENVLDSILCALVSKMSDIREMISRTANSVIDQLIEQMEPVMLLIGLCKCMESTNTKTIIATLEIMNVVGRNCISYLKDEYHYKQMFAKLIKLLPVHMTNKKVINPIVGLLLILRDVDSEQFDDLLEKLSPQYCYQIINLIKEQDLELARNLEKKLSDNPKANALPQSVIEKQYDVPKIEIRSEAKHRLSKSPAPITRSKYDSNQKSHVDRIKDNLRHEVKQISNDKQLQANNKSTVQHSLNKTITPTDLLSMLNVKSEENILSAILMTRDNLKLYSTNDTKTFALFSKEIESIFKIIDIHSDSINLCNEAYLLLYELIASCPIKIQSNYELIIYTCLTIADKYEKYKYIWEGSIQTIRAILSTNSENNAYQYIVKSIQFSANPLNYIGALKAIAQYLSPEFVANHITILVEALQKV